jgi:signal transduction histidine kinase
VKQENIAVLPEKEHLAYLVHDMRSVATSVSLMVDLLELTATAEDQSAQIDRAHSAQRSCEQMALLCSEAASFLSDSDASIESNEQFDVRDLMEELATIYSPIYELARKSFHLQLNSKTLNFYGKRQHIFRAVSNLLDNGLRHTSAGSNVHLVVNGTSEVIEIQVSDNGPGIFNIGNDERLSLPILLENYEYIAKQNIVFGSGTGLRLVQEIAAEHSGRADVEGNHLGGCTFSMVLHASQ